MAASCISASVSSGVLGAAVRDGAVIKQTGRIALAAAPSISGASFQRKFAGFSFLAPWGLRVDRKATIAARAADLGQGVELDFGYDAFQDSSRPPSQESRMPPPPVEGTKLYVGNLPWDCHSKQLAEVFQGAGNVELVEVIYDRETQKSRGFAFVTMSTVGDAQKAIDSLNGTELDGRMLRVNFPATSKGASGGFRTERPPRRDGGGGGMYNNSENKLFVGNLSWGVDDVALDELFSEYGKVLEARVVHDRDTGRSRGFGFVTLTSSSEVNHAISSLDGAEFDGRQLRVNLASEKPPPREPRDYM